MHDIFSNPFRCAVLNYLQKMENPVGLDEVVEHVLARCSGEDDTSASGDALDRWLFNEHILRLEEFGIITYDPGEESVELSDDVSVTLPDPCVEAESTPS